MKIFILTTLFILSVGIVFAAEPIKGCTNPTALNYNPLATLNDNTCNIGGGGDPMRSYQPLWGMTGFEINQLFVSLRPGERIGTDYCPWWFSPNAYGFACWTLIRK